MLKLFIFWRNVSDSTLLIVNALAYTLATLFVYRRSRMFSAGFIICAFFTAVAWGGVLFHGHPLFYSFVGTSGYDGEALTYLFVTLAVFAVPLVTVGNRRYTKAVLPNESILVKTIKVVLVIQIIQYVVMFPAVVKVLMSSNLGYARDDSYDTAEIVQFPFYALNILNRLYLGMRNVMIIIAFYALVFEKSHRTLIKIFFISSVVFPIYYFTAYVSRAVMMQELLFIVVLVALLAGFIKVSMMRKSALYLGIVAVPIVVAFIAISNSRFGELASYMFYRYLGEPMVNYAGELWPYLTGHTNGDAYFTLFSKLMGEGVNFTTTVEKWEYIEGVTGIDPSIFYTFVGGLNIEFGYRWTLLIGVLLSGLIMKVTRPYNVMTLPKLIIIGMLAYTFINGAYIFVLQGDGGNLEILFTIFFAYYFHRFSSDRYVECPAKRQFDSLIIRREVDKK